MVCTIFAQFEAQFLLLRDLALAAALGKVTAGTSTVCCKGLTNMRKGVAFMLRLHTECHIDLNIKMRSIIQRTFRILS